MLNNLILNIFLILFKHYMLEKSANMLTVVLTYSAGKNRELFNPTKLSIHTTDEVTKGSIKYHAFVWR